MRITVLGAGAIGSMIGGLIKYHEPSADVRLVLRGEHADAVCRRRKVCLIGPWGSHDVSIDASTSTGAMAGSDFVLVTTKSHDTEKAMVSALPYLGDATVISIQNGINDDLLEQFVPRTRLVMGTTVANMSVTRPGYVRLQLNGPTIIGPSRDGVNHEASRNARNLLRLTGLRVVEHPNVLGVRYNKLALNALGYTSCLSASNFITDAVCHQFWRDYVGRPILEECLEVFRRARIRLSRIPGGTDIFRIQRAFRLLDRPVLGRAVQYFAERIYNQQPILFSLLRDLERRKKTEVDHVNGQIVRLARLAGYEAPYNDLVVRSVYQLESRIDDTLFTRAEVLRRFQAVQSHPRLRIAG